MNVQTRNTFFILRLVSFITSMFPFTFYMFFTYKNDYYKFKTFFNITPSFTVWVLMVIQIISIIYLVIFFKKKALSSNDNITYAKFSDLKSERSNTSNYVLANVLPIATLDLDTELKAWFLVLIVIFLGIMYVKNDLMYINPLYDIIGVKVYEGDARFNLNGIDNGSDSIIIISTIRMDIDTEFNTRL